MVTTILPPPLRDGDRVAIVSPAGIARPADVHRACGVLRRHGLEPVVSVHALGRRGMRSGSVDERFADLAEAFADPRVRAILCTRGGYGSVELIEPLSALPLEADPKWLIGFSDITALHALLYSRGLASIHGGMARSLARHDGDDAPAQALLALLRGNAPAYCFEPHALNRHGSATAPLVGGNLATLSALGGTPYTLMRPGTILFVEDIAEAPYRVERMMWQLRLSGVMEQLAGLVVGRFTDLPEGTDETHVYDAIARIAAPFAFPMAFGAPIGHVDDNMPLVHGAVATLEVTPKGASICFSQEK